MNCSHIAIFIASTINSDDKVVPVGGDFNLTCTSSVSTKVMFAWVLNRIGNRIGVTEYSSSNGGTSVLTLSNVQEDDGGSYVCIVRVDTLIVMSNSITIDAVIIGMSIRKLIRKCLHCYFNRSPCDY